MKMDWANAKDPNDPARTAICEKILRWLEHTADWSMTLDIPAFAAVEPLSSKTGLTEFSDTLDISLLNLALLCTATEYRVQLSSLTC